MNTHSPDAAAPPLCPPVKEKKYQIKSWDKLLSLWVRRQRLGSDCACCWMNALLDWQPQTEQARRSTAKPQKPLSHGPPTTAQLQCAPNSEFSKLYSRLNLLSWDETSGRWWEGNQTTVARVLVMIVTLTRFLFVCLFFPDLCSLAES